MTENVKCVDDDVFSSDNFKIVISGKVAILFYKNQKLLEFDKGEIYDLRVIADCADDGGFNI